MNKVSALSFSAGTFPSYLFFPRMAEPSTMLGPTPLRAPLTVSSVLLSHILLARMPRLLAGFSCWGPLGGFGLWGDVALQARCVSPDWGRVGTGSRSSASHFYLSTRKKSSGVVWSTFLWFSHICLAWVGPQGGVNLVGLGRFQAPGADDDQASRRPTFLVLCAFQGHTSVKETDFHFSFFSSTLA